MTKHALILALGFGITVSTATAFARTNQVTVCQGYIIGPTAQLDCGGDFNGKASIVQLYKKGWRLVTDISGVSHKFMLIFEK